MNSTKIVAAVAVVGRMRSMHQVWQAHLLEPFERLFQNLFRSEVLRFVACLRQFLQVCSLLLFRSRFFGVFLSVYDHFLRLPSLNLTRQYQGGHQVIFLRRPRGFLRVPLWMVPLWMELVGIELVGIELVGIELVGIELVENLVREPLDLENCLHLQIRRQ